MPTHNVLSVLTGPRKAEAIRCLQALSAVVGASTPLEWIVAGLEADHAGSRADWHAEVLDVIRILLGDHPADTCSVTDRIPRQLPRGDVDDLGLSRLG